MRKLILFFSISLFIISCKQETADMIVINSNAYTVNDSFDLVEVNSQSTGSGVSITRTGSTANALEVLYEIRLFDALGAKLDTLIGDATILAGQTTANLMTVNLGLPAANTYAYAEFGLVADGNDYVLADDIKNIL